MRCVGAREIRDILDRFCVFKRETVNVFTAERNVDILSVPIGLLSECACGKRSHQENAELGSRMEMPVLEVHIHFVSLYKSPIKIFDCLKIN